MLQPNQNDKLNCYLNPMNFEKSNRFFHGLLCHSAIQFPLYLAFLVFSFFSNGLMAQSAIEWEDALGGIGYEELRCLQPTLDGGFVYACTSPSSELTSSDITEPTNGAGDYWIVKVDSDGIKVWDRRVGGSDFESAQEIQQTTDGGYIVGGFSKSPASGDKSENNYGDISTDDFWVVKLDSVGIILWERTYGGSGDEELYHIQETADGGYILGGSSDSPISGTKTAVNYGEQDYYVVKIDAVGNQLWDQSFGGLVRDVIQGMDEAADGSFYLGGYSESGATGNKSEPTFSPGRSDYWLVKIDSNGNKLWDRTYGGDSWDQIRNIIVSADQNVILAGWSKSDATGNKTTVSFGLEDMWIMKVDPAGDILWQQNYGGNLKEECTQVFETSCGELLLGGFSRSPVSGNKTGNLEGNHDYWILKTDALGNKIWDETYGGDDVDLLYDFKRSFDGGYILGGISISNGTGDRSEPSLGPQDVWIVKLKADPIVPDTFFVVDQSCNPLDTVTMVYNLINQFGCDSIVVQTTSYLESDTIYVNDTTCDLQLVGVDSVWHTNIAGCDSIVIETLSYLKSDTTFLNDVTCDPQLVGIDSIWLTNVVGCDSLVIADRELLTFEIDLTIDDASCLGLNNGSINIEGVTGGVEPYSFALNNQVFSQDTFFQILGAGSYLIHVMDATGCESSQQVIIDNEIEFQVFFTEDIEIDYGDSTTLIPQSNASIDSFSWSSTYDLLCDSCLLQTVKPITNTTFELTAFSLDGCVSEASITVYVDDSKSSFEPNAFSPNEDGTNDIFKLFFDQSATELVSFRIFNRWGEMVYEEKNVEPTQMLGWDGRFKNQNAPSGVYIYIATVNFFDGSDRVFRGDVTLLR